MRGRMLLSLLLPALLLAATPAGAAWFSAATGGAASRATAVPQVGVPSATTSGTTATVHWPAVSWAGPPVTYSVVQVNSSGLSSTPSGTCGSPVSTTSCTASLASGAWRFRVTATHGSWSGPPSVDSNAVSGLGTPTGVTATALSNAQIRVTWTGVSGATTYEVWRSTTSGSGHTLVQTVSSAPALDSSLAASTTYYYLVRAMAGSSPSAFSPEVSATTLGGSFIDISATGTNVGISCDDCGVYRDMPFNVTFYGETSKRLGIASNGFLTFGSSTAVLHGGASYNNFPLPHGSKPLTIMPLWDDLWVESPGKVLVQTIGTAPNRQYVVQWNHVGRYGFNTSSAVVFQVVFTEGSKNIAFNYGNMQFGHPSYDFGANATVGIQGPSGQSSQHSYNSAVLANGTSLVFSTP